MQAIRKSQGLKRIVDGNAVYLVIACIDCLSGRHLAFTFFEPCILIYVCNKNQQNAHIFINDSILVSSTLTEVFPCFFLSCKANARVILAKTEHGPHSSS
jgi:magnesium-transporting ATPase (P-type)